MHQVKYVLLILISAIVIFLIFLAMAYVTRMPQDKNHVEIEKAVDIIDFKQKENNKLKNSSNTTAKKYIKAQLTNLSKITKSDVFPVSEFETDLDFNSLKLKTFVNAPPANVFNESTQISQIQSFVNKPLYPYEAYKNNINGWVLLKLFITKTGTVENVEILASEPKGVFENIAVKTAYKKIFPIKENNIDPKKHTRNLKIHYNTDEQALK